MSLDKPEFPDKKVIFTLELGTGMAPGICGILGQGKNSEGKQ